MPKAFRQPFQLDGWMLAAAGAIGKNRIDDHNHQVLNLVRETMNSSNPDSLLIGNFGTDSGAQTQGDNFSAILELCQLHPADLELALEHQAE